MYYCIVTGIRIGWFAQVIGLHQPKLRRCLAPPLPPPPLRPDKLQLPNTTAISASDSKLAVVKSYRRALGLCFKCGMKWSKDPFLMKTISCRLFNHQVRRNSYVLLFPRQRRLGRQRLTPSDSGVISLVFLQFYWLTPVVPHLSSVLLLPCSCLSSSLFHSKLKSRLQEEDVC
jgi:hypothetical protein